jgi:hypothetical protein
MTVASFQPAQVSLNIAASTPTVIGGYIVPGATAAIVTGGSITNKTGNAATVDVSIWNGASDIAFIYKTLPLAANATLLFAGADAKWTLGAGQGIRFNCTQTADAVMGVMQVA